MSLFTELQAGTRRAEGRRHVQAAQLPRGPAVGPRAHGGRGEVHDPLVQQLPRASQRAERGAGRIEALHKYGAGTGACASSAAPSRCTASSERPSRASWAPRPRMSYVSAWNANEALTPTIVRGRRLRHLRRAQPRVDHRLDPPGQGDHEVHDGGVQAQRPGRPAREAARQQAGTRSASLIWTDGVFSMEGSDRQAPRHPADRARPRRDLVMDDSHATGVLGKTGRGTAEHFGVLGEVDIITSTLGKALGGAAGGFVAGAGGAVRHADAALASAAVLERAAAHGRGERAGASSSSSAPRAGHARCTRTRATSAAPSGGGLQPAAGRDADRADHRRRDGGSRSR
jgi:glycine C-acetyltransferase